MLFIVSQPSEISRFDINPNTDILLCVKSSDMLQVCDLKDKFRNFYLLDLLNFTDATLDQHIVEQIHDHILRLRTSELITYDLDSSELNGAVAYAVTMIALNLRSIKPKITYIDPKGRNVQYSESEIEKRRIPTVIGWRISRIGVSAVNCGGDTASRHISCPKADMW